MMDTTLGLICLALLLVYFLWPWLNETSKKLRLNDLLKASIGAAYKQTKTAKFIWFHLKEAFKEESQPDKSQKSVKAQPEEPSQTDSLDEILRLAREHETIKLARDHPSREHYEAYRKTSHWKKKRQEALLFYGARCQECGRTISLEVHHKGEWAYRNLGREDVREHLTVLCRDCHKAEHFGKYVHVLGGRIRLWPLSKKIGEGKMPGPLKQPLKTGLEAS